MHLVVVREEVIRSDPWAALNLVNAFQEAKERSLARLRDATAPHFLLLWGPERAREDEAIFGEDLWPYGLEGEC